MATDDINVFGSLRDFIADQSMQAVERDRAKLEAIRAAQEQFTPTAAQSAYLSAIFAPGSGIVDAAGQFPEFPSSDVELVDAFSGDPMPSIAENIAAGGIDRYLFAPLQAVGALGDAVYAANPFIASLPKGIATLGAVARAAGKADKKGIKALRAEQIQQDINAFARDSEGFVSPSLEALISKAPPNLQGKQITEWLSANANKGVKPKELEFLGVDEFIANNPNASVREVAEGVSQNKVEVGKNVYKGDAYGSAELDFDVTTPTDDPLTGAALWDNIIGDTIYDLDRGDQYIQEDLVNHFNTLRAEKFVETGSEKGIPDKIFEFDEITGDKLEQLGLGKGSSMALDDLIESYAEGQYMSNPYEMVQARQINAEGNVDELPGTFALGNEDVGYVLFANGRRIEGYEVPYSQTEAKLQLQQIINEEDLLDIDAVSGGTRYKGFVDESLPGGDNYRKIVYTWKNAPVEHDVQDHFEELSQISHALVRDRKLADGSSSLHVDELQSDLHTQGKQYGYSTLETEVEDAARLGKMSSGISTEFSKLKEETLEFIENSMGGRETIGSVNPKEIRAKINELEDLYARAPQDRYSMVRLNDGKRLLGDSLASLEDLGVTEPNSNLLDRFDAFEEVFEPAFEIVDSASRRPPNYPFKGDDWYKMSLKQLLKDAVEEGKDTISVSGSAPMIARYSDRYEKFYKSLYDQKIPSEMKKLANKYGGKFEKGGRLDIEDTLGEGYLDRIQIALDRLNPGQKAIDALNDETLASLEANIIRITPKMKQKILEEGLPSFRMGGSVNNFIAPEDINIFA